MLLSADLALLLVVAIGASAVAFDQRQTVIGQRDRATSAQVAGAARAVRRTDPELARRLAVAAARLAGTPESWSALMALRNQQGAARSARWAALSLWDLATMRLIREIRANFGRLGGSEAVFFDPDGKSVVAAPHFGRGRVPLRPCHR
ncbi:hypothetical protein HET69_01245 [Streptomyces sp. CJ_13]|uniref:hypothetical protein n=1 Tax=Streptomyces sp. CJ_13 TaxID=2724943 RepID=UPI001BDBC9F6|nr:hypothetical protein [Streptomyces sp. CJ_13]MBT1182663.1 hypothetical protein [Streptomyces sp. CJ_13]